MSYRSDKCSIDELKAFKDEVLNWLNTNFPNWNKKFQLRAYRCYNGDIRLYNGDYMEIPNTRSSFRRTEADRDENGKIIGYTGTRGHHITRIPNYITINRDEFEAVKKAYVDKTDDNWFFFNDLIFNKLN